MVKIEMLAYDNAETSVDLIENVHVCTGDPAECQDPAECEDCGHKATPEKPVYVWTSAIGIDYFACGPCLFVDEYACILLEVGMRVVIFTFDDRESYRGEIVALPENGRVVVRDDDEEDHEMIRAVVRPI